MNKSKYFLSSILMGLVVLTIPMSFSSCGSKGMKSVEEGEETQAEIEAAMMEGRSAARAFINKKWDDTLQLQNNILEARSKRIPYDTVDKPRCRAAFDSAFISTIRTTRPDIANAIHR
ncbi:MAG: hypothetical protein HDS62_03180 [Bacteroidales bacterium]|nr:hypothetical protein [Bacteroidales bacterium]MDE6538475.1 hypothetical protein [Muribaculaceae bacterium]MDE6836028.1 hypothetical protein [Muribaculaceae bacterium]